MKKFYAVTAGAPYDHRIIAITDSKEKAERIEYLYNYTNKYGDMTEIEEYEDVMQDNQVFYQVYLYDEGKPGIYLYFKYPEHNKVNNVVKIGYNSYMVVVKAEDEPHAIKIASDLIAQYKAQENGIA